MVSCKILEHFALQVGSSNWVHKLRSTPFKDGATLVPKLADPRSFWKSSSTPSKYWIKYSWSRLTHTLYYIKMLDEIQLLRIQISSCQQVFYYNGKNVLRPLSGTTLNVYLRIVEYGIIIFLQARSRMLRGKAKIATLILASLNYLMQNCINYILGAYLFWIFYYGISIYSKVRSRWFRWEQRVSVRLTTRSWPLITIHCWKFCLMPLLGTNFYVWYRKVD